MKQLTKDIIKGTYGKMKVIPDFLPTPEKLVLKKVSVLNSLYQRMMRTLLKEYVNKISKMG